LAGRIGQASSLPYGFARSARPDFTTMQGFAGTATLLNYYRHWHVSESE